MNATSTATASEHRLKDAGGFERLSDDVLRMIFRHCLYEPWTGVRHVIIENQPDQATSEARPGSMHLDLAFSHADALPLISRRSSAAAVAVLETFVICGSSFRIPDYWTARICEDATVAERCRTLWMPSATAGDEGDVLSVVAPLLHQFTSLRSLELDEIDVSIAHQVVHAIGCMDRLEVLCLKVGADVYERAWRTMRSEDLEKMLFSCSATIRSLSFANFRYRGSFSTSLPRIDTLAFYCVTQHTGLVVQLSVASPALRHLVCCNGYGGDDEISVEDVRGVLRKHGRTLLSVDVRGHITNRGSMIYSDQKEGLLQEIFRACPNLRAFRTDDLRPLMNFNILDLLRCRLDVFSLFRINDQAEYLQPETMVAFCALLSSSKRPHVLVLEGPVNRTDRVGPNLRVRASQRRC